MSVNGKALEYDDTAPGLPIKYQNGSTYNLSWDEQGNLEMVIKGLTVKKTTYGYYQNGLRAYKNTTANVRHNYYYDGDRLIAETFGTKYFLYHYDENDSIYSFTYYNGTSSAKYYLYKNIQGDVIEIRDKYNVRVAIYDYDAWGNVVSITDNAGNDVSANTTHIGYINPIRYRSYYYDVETGFYYLQSRYYDPANARFISADDPKFLGATENPISFNLFAYCENDPINNIDPYGTFSWKKAFAVGITVAAFGLLALAIVSTGGGALVLAGVGISASTATVAAEAMVVSGVAVAGTAVAVAMAEASGGKKASDSSKNERHGDNGRKIDKSQKQIEELEKQLKKATRRKEKKDIQQRINNIKEASRQAKKGETHHRR